MIRNFDIPKVKDNLLILYLLKCIITFTDALQVNAPFGDGSLRKISYIRSMTKTEIKNEIQKVLDNVPENVLQDILDLLKSLQDHPDNKLEFTHSLRQILSEDKELLEKLAL